MYFWTLVLVDLVWQRYKELKTPGQAVFSPHQQTPLHLLHHSHLQHFNIFSTFPHYRIAPTAKMKFSITIVAALLSATGMAAPANEVSMMAASPQWTIQTLNRVCDKPDATCTWNFKINTGSGAATACKYVVKSTKTTKASKANGGPATCGDFTITSGWSGQFGADKGFTTLSVVSKSKKQIIYPAYTDQQLAGGKVVKPDQAYAPASLP
ncbi:hypothetical protein CEP51_001113 [Fusarium floridanum]|uniref:Small secreted protein n=1 Tax=Fusarium floridanum TaxID=1325733 RepID=A0A428SIE3_9HYPO|nr:hypothetical protein CEP51_001113 [Fusarium floridanum]